MPTSRKLGPIACALGLLSGLLLMGDLASVLADPGAASFALGGLQFRKEPRISILSEKLTIDVEPDNISPDFNIEAEYEFRNNTNQAVSIGMAFPVPDDQCWAANSDYQDFAEDRSGRPGALFHVWVEGQQIKYDTEGRAFPSWESDTAASDLGKEATGMLRRLGIDPGSCPTVASLSQSAKANLLALGLLERPSLRNGP